MNAQYPPAETAGIAQSAETGKLGIMHLKRYWSKTILNKTSKLNNVNIPNEWQLDKTLLYTLALGLEQTTQYIFQTWPQFDEFENWIIETAGKPSAESVLKDNNLFNATELVDDHVIAKILNDDELDFWNKNGYIIIKNAVPKQDCDDAIAAICQFIEINRDDPKTWYSGHPARQNIMVQLFQHPALQKNRESVKIRQAFEQLWNRTDIWPTTDRVGFNPPETDTWSYPGQGLHWDVSLQLPIPFSLQGILYLADTTKDQGAFTLVPGFQHRIADWLGSLPEGANPRGQDMYALGATPIAANAGDMTIWHQALPHGASPNTALKPRFVQYITYEPANVDKAAEWK
jgi:hypothetical protein